MSEPMFSIKIKGLKELQSHVDDLVKDRIPKLTAIALTQTAKSLKAYTERKLSDVLDRPTRWTLNSVYLMSATPDNLSAYVWFKDASAMDSNKGTPASKYLWPEVHGGPRNMKRYEVALQRFGVLPHGYYTVPGEGVKLDSYGNISSGTITEILTGIGALVGMSDTAFYGQLGGYKRRKRSTANYFVIKDKKHGGLVPGIWERLPETGARIRKYKGAVARQKGERSGKFYSVILGRRARPVLIFVKRAPRYASRLPFYDWAQAHVDQEFPKIFNRLAIERLEHQRAKGIR